MKKSDEKESKSITGLRRKSSFFLNANSKSCSTDSFYPDKVIQDVLFREDYPRLFTRTSFFCCDTRMFFHRISIYRYNIHPRGEPENEST